VDSLPTAVDARAHDIANLDTVFRRVFTLDKSAAKSAIECARSQACLKLKITALPLNVGASRNWKDISTADVLAFLRTGTKHHRGQSL